MRAWAFILICVVGVIIIFATAKHPGSGSGGQTQSNQTQSYKDGWNAAYYSILLKGSTCHDSIALAPHGDNQANWLKGCSDYTNAFVAGGENGSPPPTFFYPNP